MEEKKRNINDIAQEFWQAIEALPIPRMDAVELLDLMDHYSRAGMDFEAELCRRVATRLDPDNMEVAITNVHWEVDNGDWSTIHSLSDSFLEAGYDRYLFDVERWVKIAQPDEAVRFVLEQLPDLCELPEYDFIYDAALLLRDYGYPRQSMQLVRRIPTEYIDYQNVKELMVDDYIALAQYEKAKIILNELIDADPFNKAFWTRLAQINLITEDYAGATDAAEYALAIDKDEEAMRYKNHAYLHQKGRVDTFIKLAALRQDYASCLEVADFCFQKGLYEQAIENYKVAALFCPRGHRDREYILGRIALCIVHTDQRDCLIDHLRSIHTLGGQLWPIAFEVIQADLEYGRTGIATSVSKLLEELRLVRGNYWNYLAELFCHYQCYDPVLGFWKQLLADPGLLSPSYSGCLAKARLHWGLSYM